MNQLLENKLSELSGLKNISPNDHLVEQLGLTSFKLMELTVYIAEHFSVDLGRMSIQGHEFHRVSDINNIISKVRQ